jgi:putative redox protein
MTSDPAVVVATAATDEREWITASVGPTGYRTEITAGPHRFFADEPVALGGTGTGPTPYEILLGALGSCMAMSLRMYADRKRWPLRGVRIHLRPSGAH